MVSKAGEPRILKLDVTPSWYGQRDARNNLLPIAVAVILQHELAGKRREIRIHLEGIEIEVVNVIQEGDKAIDVRALGADLRDRLNALAGG